jgi:aspartate/methionine/tyrosine aminotransferase
MFSSRLPARLESNAFARAVDRTTAAGRALIDLTVTNPTQVGIRHPPDAFRALASADVAVYQPEPFGMRSAREAVADDYRRRGIDVPWNRIALTSSTSEAYSLLFKLLCEPAGDSVLVPSPSYPLFEHLTALEGVAPRPYRLDYHGRWQLDFDSVDGQWDDRTRAVLAVSPNNPTGSVLSDDEAGGLGARAAARDAAVIVDEVFAVYSLSSGEPGRHGAASPATALTFRLGGLSKSAAMPQVKLGWIAVDGPERLVSAALERLEIICDTYLSVSTPVQVAAPELIIAGAHARQQVRARVRGNHARLEEAVRRHPSVQFLFAEAGWSAVLRVPSRETEEEIVLGLLERDGVVVHPGFFFDFPQEAYLVISLLPEPSQFAEGLRRVLERVDA